jgi:hypothetical protein
MNTLMTQIAAGAAAIVLIGFLWLKLDAVNAHLETCRVANDIAESINATSVEQLADASQLLADQVNEIAVNEQALADALAERDQVIRERNWAWAENDKLLKSAYTGSCLDWAQTPVCTEILEQWRLEYQSQLQ